MSPVGVPSDPTYADKRKHNYQEFMEQTTNDQNKIPKGQRTK